MLYGVTCESVGVYVRISSRASRVIGTTYVSTSSRDQIKMQKIMQKMPNNTNGKSQVVFKSTWIFEPFCPTPLIWIFDVFDVGVVSASRSL